MPVPTPEEMEKNKRFWTPFKSDASSGAAKATPSTNTAVVLPETKTENTDSDPEKRDMHKDDKATTVGDTVLGSFVALGLFADSAITIGRLIVRLMTQGLRAVG